MSTTGSATDNRNAAERRVLLLTKERTVCEILYHKDQASYGIAQVLLNELLEEVGSHQYRAVLLDRQATLHRLRGDHNKAEQTLREAISIASEKYGPLAVESTRLRSHLCLVFESAGKAPDVVRKLYEEAVAGTGTPGYEACLMLELANHEFHRGGLDAANQLYVRALPELLAAADRTLLQTRLSTCLKHLGDINFGRGEYRMARSYYEQAMRRDSSLREMLATRIADFNYQLESSYKE